MTQKVLTSFFKDEEFMAQFIINLVGICKVEGSSCAFRPCAQCINLLYGCHNHIPAAMLSPIVIFLLIRKFKLARNPKFED